MNKDLLYNDLEDSEGDVEVLVENHWEKELERTCKAKIVPSKNI